jgi:histidine ammonia-lyase
MILDNTQMILAIEALTACQALEFRKPLTPGKGPKFLYDFVRKEIPALESDRYLNPDMEKMGKYLKEGVLYQKAKEAKIL